MLCLEADSLKMKPGFRIFRRKKRKRVISHVYFLCLWIFLLPRLAYSQNVVKGTTIIIHRNELGVFIGADSKVTGNGIPSSIPVCKIQVRSSVVFFGAGLIIVTPFYNCYDIADSIIDRSGTLQEIALRFREKIMSLQDRLDAFRQADPVQFGRIFGREFFSFAFIKHEAGNNVVAGFSFRLNMLPSNHVAIECNSEFGADVPKSTEVYGEHSAIFAAFDRAHADLVSQSKTPIEIASTIQNLIHLQCEATPNYVGEPIYVVWIRTDGEVRWIIKNAPCQQLQQ